MRTQVRQTHLNDVQEPPISVQGEGPKIWRGQTGQIAMSGCFAPLDCGIQHGKSG
jgi:hypothetical protein